MIEIISEAPIASQTKNTHDHTIGILCSIDDKRLVTFSDLVEYIKDCIVYNGYVDKYYPSFYTVHKKVYTISDYANHMKITDLERFTYCPFCGEKIDWDKLKEKEDAKLIEKSK